MEWYKKYGKTYWAKHLRNKGVWTKRMANSKARASAKNAIKILLKNGIYWICINGAIDTSNLRNRR